MAFLVSCIQKDNRTPQEIIQSDYDQIYTGAGVEEISLEQAIPMALENNLDAKIAEQDYVVSLSDAKLQKLSALPSVVGRSEYIARSNSGAASSFSVLTGARSLEPSISTDQARWVSALEMNWDVLDSAINIYRSKSAVDQAIIAQERYRKVRQNIVMDLYSVFWRLAAFQMLEPTLKDALSASDENLKLLEYVESKGDLSYEKLANMRKQVIGKRKRLLDVQKEHELAALQLKALLSIPPTKDIRLVFTEADFEDVSLDLEKGNFEALVKEALLSRPEIREELLNLKISERNVNLEVLQTLPGLNIILAANHDENSFLEEANWLSLTAGISQSLTRLLTLPTRREKAENELEFTNIRRRALVAAVVSQVHISKIIFNRAYQSLLEERRTFDLSSKYIKRRNLLKESGLVGGLEEVNNQLQYEIDKIEYYNKIVDVHAAQARLINSVGADLETVTHFMLQGDDEPVEELPQAQSPQELQQIPEHGLTKEPQPQLEQQELEKDSE